MSDHDAQLLMVSTDHSHVPLNKFQTIRKINKYTISDFLDKLSCESWDTIFSSEDIDDMFNSFLNIYLRIFYFSFPLKKVFSRNRNDNNWISIGIKTNRLKYAVIKPTHKNDDRCEVSICRPVSLLTSFSKIFEMVIQRRILKQSWHLTRYLNH